MSKKVRHGMELGLWLALLFPGLIAASLLSLQLYPHHNQDFVIGVRDDNTMLQFSSFYNPERAAVGGTYRWSAADSAIGIRSFFAVPLPVLSLKLNALAAAVPAPRPVRLGVNGTTVLTLPATLARHHFELVLPATALQDGTLDLGFASTPAYAAPDPRELGFQLDELVLSWSDRLSRLPTAQTLAVQWALVILVLTCLRRIGVPKVISWSVCGGLVMLLGWVVAREQWMPTNWETPVLVTALVVCVVAWALPVLLGTRFLSPSR